MSNYKNTFGKVYAPNWLEDVFLIKNVKNAVPWTNMEILTDKKLLELFTKKELQKKKKKNKKGFCVEKVIKTKVGKLYDSSLNSWIDKKDIL